MFRWVLASSRSVLVVEQRQSIISRAARFSSASSNANANANASADASANASSSASSLKKLIQPFVLKCHPDMAQQQGLPKTAVQVNLRAIQNLNSYVDGVTTMEKSDNKSNSYPFSSYTDGLVEIEFVMAFSSSSSSNKAGHAQPTTSRRRVELQVPPPTLAISKVTPHVQRQVVKLLRMADLPIPSMMADDIGDSTFYDDEMNGSNTTHNHPRGGDISETWMADQVVQTISRKTAWDRSRERFISKINWNKFDELYEQSMHDAQANVMTKGMIRNNPKLRKQLLARILSNIQFSTQAVSPLERLVAYRRLLGILEEEFDFLHLEEFGKYWEDLRIVITQARPYNISSSAMRKRRQRHLEMGYSFTIHHDNSVTVRIPVDFRNDELIQELYRNVGDFYEWTQQDITGIESILEQQ